MTSLLIARLLAQLDELETLATQRKSMRAFRRVWKDLMSTLLLELDRERARDAKGAR